MFSFLEKYRQKLWEIHMSRPRDLQGSLRLISELKSRIEELQKCSDKLKADRERLEVSQIYVCAYNRVFPLIAIQ